MRRLGIVIALLLLPTLAYGADIATYGGQPNGSDTTPALAAAVTAACAGPDRTVTFGAGHYVFLTQPAPITCGVTLVGQGIWQTYLTRAYNGTLLTFRTPLGGGARDLTIYAAPGTHSGIAIHVHSSDAQGPAGNQIFQHLVVSGEGTWLLPIFLDGTARTIPPNGVRTVLMVNVKVFNATWWAVEWWNCVGCEWYGGGAWAGFGTTQAIAVGGAGGVGNYINAMIDWPVSVVWPGQMR